MRILVTGASGFVGGHLLPLLAGHEVTGTVGKASAADMRRNFPGVTFVPMDLENPESAESVVARARPDACFHLAGIASVDVFQERPEHGFRVNAEGWLHVLEAFRRHARQAKLVLISTAQVYGAADSSQLPLTEGSATQPDNLYAVSKLACEGLARCYGHNYGMRIVTLRPFNHIGPGQSESFVCASLARQIVAIRAGAEPVLRAGNLQSERDFTDVRDIARAYVLALEKGVPGETYNVCSGKAVSIETVLKHMLEIAGRRGPLVTEQTHKRSADTKTFFGSFQKINRATGWTPKIPLEETLKDILSHAEEACRHGAV